MQVHFCKPSIINSLCLQLSVIHLSKGLNCVKTALCLIDLVFRARGTYIGLMSRQKEWGDAETVTGDKG